MQLHIFKEVKVRVPRQKLHRLFEEVVKSEKSTGRSSNVNLVLTGDRRLKSLNRDYKGNDQTTDVLSFNIDEPGTNKGVFGEIYISIPVARRQAARYEAHLNEEIIRLACHGFLHLFGYDHMDTADEQIMKRREEHILSRVYTR